MWSALTGFADRYNGWRPIVAWTCRRRNDADVSHVSADLSVNGPVSGADVSSLWGALIRSA